MPTTPRNLGELPDDDLRIAHERLAQLLVQSGNINDTMANAPRLAAVQAEIQIRETRRLHREVTALQAAISAFDSASSKAAERLLRVTWVLVALTVGLLVGTVALLITAH